jgi:hypothetical protein
MGGAVHNGKDSDRLVTPPKKPEMRMLYDMYKQEKKPLKLKGALPRFMKLPRPEVDV